jgi:hypothetical protein
MKANAANDETADKETICEDSGTDCGILKDAAALLHELRELGQQRFLLAALETRQAAESFIAMLIAGILVAVFLNCAWLGLVAAVVLRMIEHGIAASDAIFSAVAVNLLAVLILGIVIRRKSRYLQFPATLASFSSHITSDKTGKL